VATPVLTNAGWEPLPLRIVLSARQSFVMSITTKEPGGIPDGATVLIDIYPLGTDKLDVDDWPEPLQVWPATVSDGIAEWLVAPQSADTVPDHSYARLLITYPDQGTYVWAKGNVDRDD
jgi:hypothetical protein